MTITGVNGILLRLRVSAIVRTPVFTCKLSLVGSRQANVRSTKLPNICTETATRHASVSPSDLLYVQLYLTLIYTTHTGPTPTTIRHAQFPYTIGLLQTPIGVQMYHVESTRLYDLMGPIVHSLVGYGNK